VLQKISPLGTLGAMAQRPRSDGWMTIEELSFRSGVTTRNIRAYQSRGLLAQPVSHPGSRASFYTAAHLARLRLVDRLQARGFSLAGIGDLLRAWGAGRSLEEVLGIEGEIADREEQDSVLISAADLRQRIAGQTEPAKTIAKLGALGLVERHADGYRIRLPKVFDLGVDAAQAGIPLDALLEEFVRLQDDLHRVALRFVALFTSHVLGPYLEAGMPPGRLPVIVEQAKRLRSLAVEATLPLMRQAIADEIDSVSHKTVPEALDAGRSAVAPPKPEPKPAPSGRRAARDRRSTRAPRAKRR